MGTWQRSRAQIALEFIVIYSVVLTIFVIVFALAATQRAASLERQQNAFLQMLTQDIASQITIALAAGNGYSTSVQLPQSISSSAYSIYVSSSGVVFANMSIGSQVLNAQAGSAARNLVINGTAVLSGGPTLYRLLAASGIINIYNYFGTVYLNLKPPAYGSLLGSVKLNYTYGNPSLLKLNATSLSGNAFAMDRVGLVLQQGSPSSPTVSSVSTFTDQNGRAVFPIIPSSSYPLINASVYALPLNGSVSAALQLWLPIRLGVPGMVSSSIKDLSGNNANGIIADANGGGSFTAPWIPPKQNTTSFISGYSDGSTTGVVLPPNSGFDTLSNLTVIAWVNLQQQGEIGDIISSTLPLASRGLWDINVGYDEAGFPEFTITNFTNYDCTTEVDQLTPGIWYQLAGTYSQLSSALSVYVNGNLSLATSCRNIGAIAPVSSQVIIGGGAGLTGFPFKGSIANVQIYNASLSAGQISSLYSEGVGGAPLATQSLVGWWPLNGDTQDHSSRGLNAWANSVISFKPSLAFYNASAQYIPNLLGGNGWVSYASRLSAARLGVNPASFNPLNFSVNTWFMIGNSISSYSRDTVNYANPVIDIYNGIGAGLGGNQNFDLGGSWAGGTFNRFSWGEYWPTNEQFCNTQPNSIQANVLYNAVVSVSRYTNVTVYIDGQRAAACSFSASPSTVASYATNLMLAINGNPPGGNERGTASVYDVEVYNITLTQQQAAQLYSFGQPLYGYLKLP